MKKHRNAQTVWLLTIMHPNGTEFYVCDSEDLARDQLFDFVDEYWDDEFDNEMPEDRDDAIYDYFFENEEESYILTPRKVQTEVAR
jgi:hypothetical protein